MAVEELGQPLPHVHHRRVHRQVEHLPRHPIALDSQQPVRMVTRSGGVRLDQLEFDREPDFKIKAADPRQQPIEIGRRSVSVKPALSAYGSRPAREHQPMSSRNVSAPTAAAYSARPSIACRSW